MLSLFVVSEKEWKETQDKANALLKALDIGEKGGSIEDTNYR